ncbi:MAG: PAS domain S-box protein [Desulfobacula sp.]|nr:PAS domain S-box protein [Desulfobacula sp.]
MQSQEEPVNPHNHISLSRRSLEKATISYINFTPDKRIVYANPFACKIFGYSPEDFLTKNIFDISPNLSEKRWAEFWETLREQFYFHYFDTCKRKDGVLFPIEARAYWIEDNEKPTAAAFMEDLTEKRKLESDALLKQFIFQKSATAILQGGKDGRILDVNEEACNCLGYTKEELCNMTIFELDASFSEGEIGEIWDTTQAQQVFTFESMHRRKDGTVFPVEITANSHQYNGLEFSICFFKDITEQKREQQRKDKANEQLQKTQKLEALGILAGGIAHDFNNILSGVLGYAELATLRLHSRDEIHKYLQPIIAAGQRAKRLVNQILAFSRQEKSKKAPIDLSRVIMESVDLIRASIPSTIEIKRDIKPNLGLVLADETMIHQVIMNLCTNAYHAIEKKGRAGTLEVLLERITITNKDCLSFPELIPGRFLKLIVADTGHGMDKETITRIFDPYFTTKASGEGTGLGLSVVHGIIKSHGGAIRVYSELDVGTTFHVLFPMEETTSEEPAQTFESLPNGNECLLLVDDEELLLNLGKEFLEGLGYQVETRASSIDALEAVRARPEKFDLIVSDLTMPHMPGDIFAKEVKKLRPNLPVILCTGYSDRIDQDMFREIGIKDFLMKPVLLHELAASVRKILDTSS